MKILVRTATGWLIAINVAIWVAMVLYFGYEASDRLVVLAACGAKMKSFIDEGQTWRLMSCTFLHGGFVHLLLNMWALLNLGLVLEVTLGTAAFSAVYAVAGLAGSWATYRFNAALSIGASGAVFGVGGGLLVASYLLPERLPPALREKMKRISWTFIGLNLVIGLGINQTKMVGIDNHAHIGGLVGGMAATFVVWLLMRAGNLFAHLTPFLFVIGVALPVWGLVNVGLHMPAGLAQVEVASYVTEVLGPLRDVLVKHDKGIRGLEVMNVDGPPPAPEKARAMRDGAIADVDARRDLAKRLAALPRLRAPEVQAGREKLAASLKPLDGLRDALAKLPDRDPGPGLLALRRERPAEWQVLFDETPIVEAYQAINDRMREFRTE